MRDLVTSCSAGYLNRTPLIGKYFYSTEYFRPLFMVTFNDLFYNEKL